MIKYSKHLSVSVCAAMLLAACGAEGSGDATQAQPAPAPLSVDAYRVDIGPIQNTISFNGRARAFREAEIRPEVSGLITERLFEEGQQVSKGTALYKIDSARYAAEVQSAKAGLERAEAASKLADETLARFTRLSEIRAVSRQEYDQALAAANQAKADISLQRAAVDRTSIDFSKTTVRSPIDGQIGRSAVTTGALVTANQAQSLARILQLDPINVDVAVPSLRVIEFNRQLEEGEIKLNEDQTADVDIFLENGQPYDHPGKFAFREVSVDETSGSVTLRATVPNPDGTLLPGMYLKTNLNGSRFNAAATIPQDAVTRTVRGDATVFIVGPDNKVENRIIQTAGNLGNNWIVTEGLAQGELVVTSNLQRVREGMTVTPVVAPKGN